MKKLIFGAAIVVIGVLGAAVWYRQHVSDMTYTTFNSARLRVRFDYPATWQVHDVTHPKTAVGEIQIFGPRREDIQYSSP